MRTLATACFSFGLALLAPLALAGDRGDLPGCGCQNACPLAQQANERRSTGNEAVFASKAIRAEVVRAIAANLKSV